MKKFYGFILVSVFTIILVACDGDNTVINDWINDSTEDTSETIEYEFDSVEYSESDYLVTYDEDGVVYIDLDSYDDEDIYIPSSGTYVFSGTLSNGQILIDSSDNFVVRIVLDNANITSLNSAAIYVLNAERTIITTTEASVNTISDTENHIVIFDNDEELSAAIYSNDPLVFNGEGSLTINGNYSNGIKGDDEVLFISGDITINSDNDGIKANNYVAFDGATIDIVAGGDGVVVSEGFIEMNDGDISISMNHDGFDAYTYIVINGGSLYIDSYKYYNTADSLKGLKSTDYILITNGDIIINTYDDAIHSNGDITITGGTLTLDSDDDGIHADLSLLIENAFITINSSYEGLESENITINSGTIALKASDDGINITSSSSTTTSDPFIRMPGGGDSVTDGALTINGGIVYVDSVGDGLDSNGSIYMYGGLVIVNGSETSMNGGLDYNGTCIIDGGTLVVTSVLGMVEAPSSSSDQLSIVIGFDRSISSGNLVNIQDSDGNSLLTFEAAKTFQALVFSSSDISLGETYKIYINGTASGDDLYGFYTNGTYSDGTSYLSFKQSSYVTYVGGIIR